METDPIIIRIQAIDEATSKIRGIASSLKSLEMKVPDIGGGYKQVNVIRRNLEGAVTPLRTLEKETANFQRSLGRMQVQPVERLNQSLQIAGITQKQFTTFLSKNNMVMIKGVGVYDQLNGTIMTQGQAVKQATVTMRRFKFEWLSIMFAGMALERVFSGIVRAQMDLYGVTKMTADMWTIVMADAMDLVSIGLYNIIEQIMALPPETQMIIGLTVFGGDILGKILSGLGQIFLALMGIRILFPKIGIAIAAAGGGMIGVFKAIGAAIMGVSATFLIVAGIVAAILIGMYLAWKKNFMGMKEVVKGFIEGVKLFFSGFIDIFKGIFMIISGLFSGNFDKLKEGFIKLLKGFGNLILGVVQIVINAILAITIGVIRVVIGIVQTVVNGIIQLVNAISRLFGGEGKIKEIDWVNALSRISMRPLINMPHFQKGGIMPYTGVAYLHAGEKVISKNQVNSSEGSIIFSPTVNINAEVSSDLDIRNLADKLNYYWAKDFERMTQRRVT